MNDDTYALPLGEENEVVISFSMMKNKLRRVLGYDHLEVYHIDMLNLLSGPDCAQDMLDLIYAKNPELKPKEQG